MHINDSKSSATTIARQLDPSPVASNFRLSCSDHFNPVYIPDCNVGPELDLQLRALLLEAFPSEAKYVSRQRYFRECPAHRWIILDPRNQPISHIAAHEKTVGTLNGPVSIMGVAEVCVTASFRRRGLTRRLLQEIHLWAKGRSLPFSLLFGDIAVYRSSGYQPAVNVFRYWKYQTQEWVEEPISQALFLPLGVSTWPKGTIDLAGPLF